MYDAAGKLVATKQEFSTDYRLFVHTPLGTAAATWYVRVRCQTEGETGRLVVSALASELSPRGR